MPCSSRFTFLRADGFKKALAEPKIAEAFDWVQTLEDGKAAHALEQWKTSHSLPWLSTVSLLFASGKDPDAAELIAQADGLSTDSPAFGTATYNAVRLPH